MGRRLALAALALFACRHEKTDVAPPPDASPSAVASAKPKPPPPPAPPNPMTLTLDGKDTPLASQIAYVGEGGVVTVVLADRPISCDELGAKFVDDTSRRSLSIVLPPGPNASYFAGTRAGVTGQIDAPNVPSYITQNELTADVASVDIAPGGRVRGWATWERGALSAKGTFDAKTCASPFASPAPALAAEPPTGAPTGNVGEAFAGKKTLAVVRHDKKIDADYVSEIDVFAADATCDDAPATDKRTPSLAITQIGNATPKHDHSQTMQPMLGMFAPASWKVGKPRVVGRGWIRLESLDFSRPLEGTFRFVSPKGSIAGAFSAEVCKK